MTLFDETSSETDTTEKPQPSPESLDGFYPIFWALQKDFSSPTRLLESEEHFTNFKAGLEKTMDKFSATPVVRTRSDDSRGVKRKRGHTDDTAYQGDYNPKYLTSKELFELEVCYCFTMYPEGVANTY